MKKLLHYGLQRSGTNFLETLLLKNYNIKILNSNKHRHHPLQKHFRLYNDKRFIPEPSYSNSLKFNSFEEYEKAVNIKDNPDGIIIISKNPYSWLDSYKKWARKCNWPEPNYEYIEEYNLFYQKWMEFSKEDNRIYFIKYKDLLFETETQLKKIEDKFQLSLKGTRKIFGRIVELKKVDQSKNFRQKKYTFYKNREYLKLLTSKEIKIINSTIDPNLLTFMDYKFETQVSIT